MKTIYVFPALVITAAIFSGGCQKNDQPPAPKKGSSPSTPPAKEAPAKVETKADDKTTTETKIDHASAVEASALMEKDNEIVVLDIRTPEEYGTGHIPKSVNINFKSDSFADELKKLDPNKTYLVHCRSGGRSTSSLKVFSNLKFHHIIHLDGGMMDWGKEQLPVEK